MSEGGGGGGEPAAEIREIPVRLGPRSHPILVGRGLLGGIGTLLARRTPRRRALVVSDSNVAPLYGGALRASLDRAGFATGSHTLRAGEPAKSLRELGRLYDLLAERRHESGEPIVALGGGVVGDLAGLAAGTYRRGIPVVHVPTSLIAQVDSSIGGKTAVNLALGKNLVGVYHQPLAVYTDPDLLATLPGEEYRAGLAEVVKYAVIADAPLFSLLEERHAEVAGRDREILLEIVRRCARIKAGVVERDEREEKGERHLLNLGHTVGHALETVLGYGTIRHGEAVAVGTACACKAAVARGLLAPRDSERIVALLARLHLPVTPPPHDSALLLECLRRDKKVEEGRIRFVLPLGVGRARVEQVTEEEALATLVRGAGGGDQPRARPRT